MTFAVIIGALAVRVSTEDNVYDSRGLILSCLVMELGAAPVLHIVTARFGPPPLGGSEASRMQETKLP